MKKGNIMLLVVLAAVAIILLGLAMALQNNTIVDWWIPAGVCALLALPCGYVLRGVMRKITRWDKSVWNILSGVVFSFAVIMGAFYALNFYGADPMTGHDYSAPIVNKYSEERYRTHRVGRNRYRRGEKYYAYFVVTRLEDGRLKKMEVPVGEFAKLRTGAKVKMRVEAGFFGIPVIKKRQLSRNDI